MNKQISLSYVNYELVQTITKKKIFLTKIEGIIPFGNWKTPNQGHTTTKESAATSHKSWI